MVASGGHGGGGQGGGGAGAPLAPGQLSLWDTARGPSAGRLCRATRDAAGWSQAALARAVGMTQSSLSRSETGARSFSIDELVEIARVLHVPIADLVGTSPAALRRRWSKAAPPRIGASRRAAEALDAAGRRRFVALGGSLRAVDRVRAGQPLAPSQASLIAEAAGVDLATLAGATDQD